MHTSLWCKLAWDNALIPMVPISTPYTIFKKYVNPQGESDSSTQVTLRKRRRGYTSFKEEEEEDEEEEEEEEEANKGKRTKKGKKSSAVLGEGSRCSRVNGRGWRCYQQTLYGYSLCEHHLGKGRVRSTNKSSGGRSGGQKKEVTKTKKRVKLGMVKARSMSSLLGQTSTSSGIADVVEIATESEISAPADH
ncbi:WRC domain-containing protein [Hirschfeldia incana]|nr:WRC domain-containing protein [Hirschfeldia incana]